MSRWVSLFSNVLEGVSSRKQVVESASKSGSRAKDRLKWMIDFQNGASARSELPHDQSSQGKSRIDEEEDNEYIIARKFDIDPAALKAMNRDNLIPSYFSNKRIQRSEQETPRKPKKVMTKPTPKPEKSSPTDLDRTSAKKQKKKKKTKLNPKRRSDLRILYGIGDNYEKALNSGNIFTIEELSKISDDTCQSLKPFVTTIILLRKRAQEFIKSNIKE